MKKYVADNGFFDDGAVFIEEDGVRRPLNPRYDLRNHSPTGFAWGYLGSGPAQLALAILADAIANDLDRNGRLTHGIRGW